MSNNNLNNCKKAIESLNMSDYIKITIGKNPKQATRLTFSNGKDISVSAVTTMQQFIDVINANMHGFDNSIAVSKYNNYNADTESEELAGWLSEDATYAKKDLYNYKDITLTDVITWSIEDFGYTEKEVKKYHDLWNSEKGIGFKKANTKMMLFCNEKYTPIVVLQNTIKQWLSHHEMYEHTNKQLLMIINKYAEMVRG